MNITWIEFWISALACYRLTILISRCLGPWGIFKKLRSIDRCSKLLKCPFCVSMYVGALTCVGLYFAGYVMPLPTWIILSLAFSAITIMADRTFTSDHNPQ
jgi:hypothetical protein